MEEVLKEREKSFDQCNEALLRTRVTHATCLAIVGRREEAEGIQRDLISTFDKELGWTHTLTLELKRNYAHNLFKMGMFEEAKKWLQFVLENYSPIFSYCGDHENIEIKNELLHTLMALEEVEEVDVCFKELIELMKQVYGKRGVERIL